MGPMGSNTDMWFNPKPIPVPQQVPIEFPWRPVFDSVPRAELQEALRRIAALEALVADRLGPSEEVQKDPVKRIMRILGE